METKILKKKKSQETKADNFWKAEKTETNCWQVWSGDPLKKKKKDRHKYIRIF